MTVAIPLVIFFGILAWLLSLGKEYGKSRNIAMMITIIPVAITAVIAVILQVLHNSIGGIWVSDLSNACFIFGLILLAVYLLAVLVFAVARKKEIARGLGFGICIGIIISIIEFGVLEWLAAV